MELKTLFLSLFGISAILLGFAVSYLNPMPNEFAQIPFIMVLMGLFLAGIVFFGCLSIIPALFFGFEMGAEKNAAIFLYLVNAFAQWKMILTFLIIALIMATVIEMALPHIIQLWPKDFLGLNITEGKTVTSLIGDIAKLVKH
ncbi:MAG: hypothetical protein NTY48_04840 [Candidatus Diapherotrites archaeon]|nr:hypothetical protein [Candidatus Diapherotrites archaeon]